jgi:hypothetical protein
MTSTATVADCSNGSLPYDYLAYRRAKAKDDAKALVGEPDSLLKYKVLRNEALTDRDGKEYYRYIQLRRAGQNSVVLVVPVTWSEVYQAWSKVGCDEEVTLSFFEPEDWKSNPKIVCSQQYMEVYLIPHLVEKPVKEDAETLPTNFYLISAEEFLPRDLRGRGAFIIFHIYNKGASFIQHA